MTEPSTAHHVLQGQVPFHRPHEVSLLLHKHKFVKMATFIRSKQAGMQKDLSAGIPAGAFLPGEQIRYGINSQIRLVQWDCLPYSLPPC